MHSSTRNHQKERSKAEPTRLNQEGTKLEQPTKIKPGFCLFVLFLGGGGQKSFTWNWSFKK